MKILLIISIFILGILPIKAQEDSTQVDIFDLSLEELMNLKISSVSKKAESIQEALSR